MTILKSERGDTIIEVIIAMVLLSTIIVGSVSIMNFGIKSTQVALEHSLVRTQINGQVAMLQYVRDEYMRDTSSTGGQIWSLITANGRLTSSKAAALADCESVRPFAGTQGRNYYITAGGAGSLDLAHYPDAGDSSQLSSIPGKGMWYSAYKSTGTSALPAAIDIVIKACWEPVGGGTIQSEKTVVRLYDGK